MTTGKTTTCKRSTTPSRKSVAPSEMLPRVRSGAVPSVFMRRSAPTASSATIRVLAHVSGGFSVEEKTIFGISAMRANVGSSASETTRDIAR